MHTFLLIFMVLITGCVATSPLDDDDSAIGDDDDVTGDDDDSAIGDDDDSAIGDDDDSAIGDDDDATGDDDDSAMGDDDDATGDDDDSAMGDDDDATGDDDDSAIGDDDDATGDDDDLALPPPSSWVPLWEGSCPWDLFDACADDILEAPGATGEGFFDPTRAANGVRGGGSTSGSFDVYSVGYGEDSLVTLGWSGRRVQNGPGVDFIVFENGFALSGGGIFMDQVVVEVSLDAENWVAMPHDYLASNEREYSFDPLDWSGFAGVTPVLLHEEDNPVVPTDPLLAGGDAFDLDDLPGDEPESEAIRVFGFRYVRLLAAYPLLNPDTGMTYPRDPISNGPDIDGVYAASLVED